jgi:late competence protein required for DNA uptake (superfamily II DNA/RNA helicase)
MEAIIPIKKVKTSWINALISIGILEKKEDGLHIKENNQSVDLDCKKCGERYERDEMKSGMCASCQEEERQQMLRASAVSEIVNNTKAKIEEWLTTLSEAQKCLADNKFFDKEAGHDSYSLCGANCQLHLYQGIDEIVRILEVPYTSILCDYEDYSGTWISFYFNGVEFSGLIDRVDKK